MSVYVCYSLTKASNITNICSVSYYRNKTPENRERQRYEIYEQTNFKIRLNDRSRRQLPQTEHSY